ncbi:MAG: Thiamine biosynthesis lipoprotein ApbE precursor [candidate division BRC1 bacterium ADurb.BinA364]|nr:MAG: Thiamine biosynthesis lipoprotein ApbE precursor [candidate division BRC1 bacterium ADurb.BinA364]
MNAAPRGFWRPLTVLAGAASLLVAIGLWTRSQSAAAEPIALSGFTMGTQYSIKIVLDSAEEGGAETEASLAQGVESLLERVNAQMSTYREDSELSRFNAHRSLEPFGVSAPTLLVFELASEVSKASGGAFDVTVGPLVDAYGFGAKSESSPQPPGEAALRALRERVGADLVEIDASASALRKRRADVECDLSAIAKGYGVDVVADWIESRGFRRYMVEIGGEVRALGRNAQGQAWRIGIEKPLEGSRAIQRVVPLDGMALATSGDYRNFYMLDGKRISHTIDPRSGKPIEHGLASVTVLDRRCVAADAWATALNVLGPEDGYELAKRRGMAVYMLARESNGEFRELATPEFEHLGVGGL